MFRRLLLSAALAATAAPVFAHTGVHTEASAFVAGLQHPVTGADHLAAMIAVGVWSALVGGGARLAWPLAFVAAFVTGSAMPLVGLSFPMVESAIAVTVVIAGLLIALAVRLPAATGAAIVALFAVLHGYAHGTEMPAGAWVAFMAGCVATTAALHVCGIGIGTALERHFGRVAVRGSGAAIALAGVAMLAAG